MNNYESNENDTITKDKSTRKKSSVSASTIKPNMDETFPILIRKDIPTDTFSIDLRKYGIMLDSLNLSLNSPATVLYITLTIPDNTPFSINNVLSYFKLDSTMFRTINNVEMIFNIDGFTDIKLYKVMGNRLVEIELNKEDATHKVIMNDLGEFVLTGSSKSDESESKPTEPIESTAIFPSRNDINGDEIDDKER